MKLKELQKEKIYHLSNFDLLIYKEYVHINKNGDYSKIELNRFKNFTLEDIEKALSINFL